MRQNLSVTEIVLAVVKAMAEEDNFLTHF